MDYIAEIQAALLALHGVTSTYVESVPVTEEFQGETVWQGEVEVFEISGHPKAKYAYCWGYGDENRSRKYVTVLELPPVDSPQTAVKAAVMQEIKNARQKTKGRPS